MSIKHAVLGLLRERPMHGYAVRAAFEERLGHFWELNYGQVYQVLTTLEQEGLVAGTDERVGRRPTRKVYAISGKGYDALQSWLVRRPVFRPFRDDFYIRLLFTDPSEQELVGNMIEDQLQASQEHLAALIDRRASESGVSTSGARSPATFLFAQAAVLHAKADIEALELCRKTLLKAPALVEAQPSARSVRRLR